MQKAVRVFRQFLMLVMVVTLIGCGSTSSSSSSSSSSSEAGSESGGSSSTAYSGNYKLSGVATALPADVQAVSNSSASAGQYAGVTAKEMNAEALELQQNMRVISSTEQAILVDAVAMLYGVSPNGTITFTGKSVEVDSSGAYAFSDIKHDQRYIVEIVKYGAGDSDETAKKVTVKAYVKINEGAKDKAQTLNVEPGLDRVVTAIIEKLKELNLSDDIVDTIIEIVVSVIQGGLNDGSIAISSTVEDVPLATGKTAKGLQTELIAAETATMKVDVEGADLIDALADLDNNEELQSKQTEAEVAGQLSSGVRTFDSAKSLMRLVFNFSDSSSDSSNNKQKKDEGGDEGIPEFFVDQFAKAFVNEHSNTMREFVEAYTRTIKRTDQTDNMLSNFRGTVASKLKKMYAFYDTGVTSNIAGFDTKHLPVVKAVFPSAADKRWVITDDKVAEAQTMNAAQLVMVFQFAGLFDKTNQEADEMDPMTFLSELGVLGLETGKVYVIESEVRPVKTWIEEEKKDDQDWNNWIEKDALDARVTIYLNSQEKSIIDKVVLRYPKEGGGTGEATFKTQEEAFGNNNNNQGEHSEENARVQITRTLSKRVASHNDDIVADNHDGGDKHGGMEGSVNYFISPWNHGGGNNAPSPTIIENYTSGTATIEVWNKEEVIATSSVSIIRMSMKPIQWVLPKGPNLEKEKEFGWDDAFEPQALALGEGEKEIQPLLQWKTPTGDIPAGHHLAYAISIGLSVQPIIWDKPSSTDTYLDGISWDWKDFGDKQIGTHDEAGQFEEKSVSSVQGWKHMWDTWENRRMVRGNEFKLPVPLPATIENTEANYRTTYEADIRPLLVNSSTKRVVWEGTGSHTNFSVGAGSTWIVTLNGTVKFPDGFLTDKFNHIGEEAGTWRIGLFQSHGKITTNNWGDQFNDAALATDGARYPIKIVDTYLVDELGTNAEVKNNPTGGFAYTLPPISKDDAVFKKNQDVQLVVWFDYTSAPTNRNDWKDHTAVSGAVDFKKGAFSNFPIEEHDRLRNRNLRLEGATLILDIWDNKTNQGERRFLTSEPENQIIDINAFEWFDRKPN